MQKLRIKYVLSDRNREALMDVSGQVTSCGSPISLPVPTRTGCPVSPQVPCLMSGLSDIAAGSELGSYTDLVAHKVLLEVVLFV